MNPYTLPAWTAAGWTMLHLVWIGGLIGALGAASRWLLRKARPETRYAAALLFLGLFAVAPLALFARVYQPVAVSPSVVAESTKVGTKVSASGFEAIRLRLPGRSMISDAPQIVAAPTHRWESLVARLPWLWLIGSTATLASLGLGLAGVGRMRRSSRALIDGDVAVLARRLASSLGVTRRVVIGVCDRIVSPVLLGVLRPMILLPSAALSGWTADELEMALLHELAHLRRHDNLVNLLQCLVEALLFFHPAAWWLSSWVRLERELCCDRLVVARTGQSRAYANLLASLVGVHCKNVAVSALAEKPILTRIRKILNMEDRPMRLTMPEGFGLIAAAVVAGALAIGAQARTTAGDDKPKVDEAVRKTLRTMAEKAATAKPDESQIDGRGAALLGIASAQFKIGDHEAAKATMREACRMPNPAAKKSELIAAVETQIDAVEVWREAGDLNSARDGLDRATKALSTLSDPKGREALDKEARADGIPTEFENEEFGGFMLAQMANALAEQRIKLGDPAEARRLVKWAMKACDGAKGETKAYMCAALGGLLVRAGDKAGGLALIEQARAEARALPAATAEQVNRLVVRILAECGELDAAFAPDMAQGGGGSDAAAVAILDALKEYDASAGVSMDDISAIKILIGAPGVKPKGSATALGKLAARLGDLTDAKVKARSLSTVAHLLAMSGDFRAATKAAEAIPAITRNDFAGPSDGFYDSVKPGTFALVAAQMAKKGDKAGAAAMFDRSEALIRDVKRGDEALMARIVLADSLAEAGDKLAALEAVREAIVVAKVQAEPRRSRGLAMLVAIQAKAGDPAGAVAIVDAIRPYPGVEKMRALSTLSHTFETDGDPANSRAMARLALECAEVKKPDGFKLGPVTNINAFGADTFIDPDLEFPEPFAEFERLEMTDSLQAKATSLAEAERAARAKPPVAVKGAWGGPGMALGSLAANLAYKGELDEAMRIIGTIDDSHDKLWAYQQVARNIRDRPATK